jgi:betaine-aldehyde dehydrogenase
MLEEVNAVEYGLTCSIWTNDLSTAHRTAGRCRPAMSGSTKCRSTSSARPSAATSSPGIGREECLEEMIAYTQEKNIHLRLRKA